MEQVLIEPLNVWASGVQNGRLCLSGTAIDLDGAGLLALGPSGTGKSSLALALCAFGARLICDDAVYVTVENRALHLHRPDQAIDLIEARGIGLLRAGPVIGQARLDLVVDLSRTETDRMPPKRRVIHDGAEADLILGANMPNLAISLIHLLRHGRGQV